MTVYHVHLARLARLQVMHKYLHSLVFLMCFISDTLFNAESNMNQVIKTYVLGIRLNAVISFFCISVSIGNIIFRFSNILFENSEIDLGIFGLLHFRMLLNEK